MSSSATRSPGSSSGSGRTAATRSPAKQHGPATSCGTGAPSFCAPEGWCAVIRSGQASGMKTVRVATWAPAWVTAIRRPPEVLVYSTYAAVNPFLASSERPNSVASR